eukprot:TRINITY_DN28271_c0_g1_i1.p1 TRINITY_DN28271_c0_g1~~TRINITY_DN28271_c0_g1_i1.p1  ORF type:complete len:1183 (+),score=181.53 TRINITY_DN28271_c0_g1_i1:40-3549(+)
MRSSTRCLLYASMARSVCAQQTTVTESLEVALQSTDCGFSWGSFPEFLALHCRFDWEAAAVVLILSAFGLLSLGLLIVRIVSKSMQHAETQQLRQQMHERTQTNRCTFGVTLSRPCEQEWWRCRTCYGISDMGVCAVCAKVCHKGHDLEKSRAAHHLECRFCNCGASGRCRCNKDKDDKLVQEIREYYDSERERKKASISELSQEEGADETKLIESEFVHDVESVRFHWHSGVDGPFFSAKLVGGKSTDFRIFEYMYAPQKIKAMGAPRTGQEAETVEQAVMEQWDKVYAAIDVDGDGVLSKKEIQQYFKRNTDLQERLSVSDGESFEELLREMDKDGDGEIDRSEFALLVQKLGLGVEFPNSLELTINGATGLVAADTMGTSDPYVSVEFYTLKKATDQADPKRAMRERTQVVHKTLKPVWNERFQFDLGAAEGEGVSALIKFCVWDWDKLSEHDFLGYAEQPLATVDMQRLMRESDRYELKLVGRPGRSEDVEFLRRRKGQIGTLDVNVRCSAHGAAVAVTTDQGKLARARKYGEAGRATCSSCRRRVFFVALTDKTAWVSAKRGGMRWVRRLPHCICGVELVPDSWRDELRSTLEPYRAGRRMATPNLDPDYPLSLHVSMVRRLGWWVRALGAALNVWSIVESFRRRPERDPDQDLNLAVISFVSVELILLGVTTLRLLWEWRSGGLRAFLSVAPSAVLGTHLFKVIPIGWFPSRWVRWYRQLDQRASSQNTRHPVASVGVVLSAVGCTLFFVTLPFFCMTAKLAFLRLMFDSGNTKDGKWQLSWTISDVALAMNFASNMRSMVAEVYNKPPHEHRLPKSLWSAMMTTLQGPQTQTCRVLRTMSALVTFTQNENDLTLLYEIFVLNNDGIIIRERERKNDGDDDESGSEEEDARGGTGKGDTMTSPLLNDTERLDDSVDDIELQGSARAYLREAARLQTEFDQLKAEKVRLERELDVARHCAHPLSRAVKQTLSSMQPEWRSRLQQAVSVCDTRFADLVEAVRAVLASDKLEEEDARKLHDALAADGAFVPTTTAPLHRSPRPPVRRTLPPSRARRHGSIIVGDDMAAKVNAAEQTNTAERTGASPKSASDFLSFSLGLSDRGPSPAVVSVANSAAAAWWGASGSAAACGLPQSVPQARGSSRYRAFNRLHDAFQPTDPVTSSPDV